MRCSRACLRDDFFDIYNINYCAKLRNNTHIDNTINDILVNFGDNILKIDKFTLFLRDIYINADYYQQNKLYYGTSKTKHS